MASRIRYARLATERANPRSRALDLLSPRAIAALMNREDRRAVLAVGRVRSAIASAVRMIVGALRGGGRLFFVGAGTSGRLGVLEAAECPPRSEEHTSELQSRQYLVCRLLLEKTKVRTITRDCGKASSTRAR